MLAEASISTSTEPLTEIVTFGVMVTVRDPLFVTTAYASVPFTCTFEVAMLPGI